MAKITVRCKNPSRKITGPAKATRGDGEEVAFEEAANSGGRCCAYDGKTKYYCSRGNEGQKKTGLFPVAVVATGALLIGTTYVLSRRS